MLTKKRIAVVGAGHMGQALIGGLINAQLISADRITASRRKTANLEKLQKEWGVSTSPDNGDAITGADIVLIAVKPQVAPSVLDELASTISENQLVISMMAGLTTEFISARLGKNCPVIRAMPNTPALVDEGATAIAKGAHASDDDVAAAHTIFAAVGLVEVVPERLMNAVTGLSGSGPVYIYMVIEALIDAGVKVGLPRKTARRLAIQTVYGSAKLVMETGKHPAVLRDEVTTPAGTAIEGIHVLESKGLRTDLMDAVVAATRRSEELSHPDDE